MKTLYLECNMGASGDMLMAALLELYPDKEGFLKRMNSLVPSVTVTCDPSVKCGITGTHVTVTVSDYEEESEDVHFDAQTDHVNSVHEHEIEHEHGASPEHTHSHNAHDLDRSHDHSHNHNHDHSHDTDHDHSHDRSHSHSPDLHGIYHIVESLDLPERVKSDTYGVYKIIAEAESIAHNVPAEMIHFHEVGSLDAIIDIAGVCLLIYLLSPDQILASPVHVGFGNVRCAHGILPVPAPATAEILKGIPTYGGRIRGELCTPTGAALLRHFAAEFGYMPTMAVSTIGYGMGKKDFEAANCVRAFIGETAVGDASTATNSHGEGDAIDELCCNLDDMTAEAIGYASDLLFEAGALDVFSTPIQMKKSRPAVLFTCLCKPADTERLTLLILKHTTTIGVRKTRCARTILSSSHTPVQTPYGEIRVKVSQGHGILKYKPEFEDIRIAANKHGVSAEEVQRAALAAYERI